MKIIIIFVVLTGEEITLYTGAVSHTSLYRPLQCIKLGYISNVPTTIFCFQHFI